VINSSLCRRTFLIAFVLTAALVCTRVHAQQAVEVWKAPHFSIDARTLYTASSAVAAADNSSAVVLEDDESYSFDAQGRSVHTAYIVYKILSSKGAESWDSASVYWEPWHQQHPRIQVRVISPDLSVHILDQKQITEAPAHDGDYKSYSDAKTLRAPFPAIEPGVVVEEEFITTETVPFFSAGRTGRIYFGRERTPIQHSVAEIDAPPSLPLRSRTVNLDNLQPQRTESSDRVTLVYEKGRLEGFDPQENNLPSDYSAFPIIEFSTGASWQAMARTYSTIVDDHAQLSAVQSIVDGLIAGKTTVAEKEAALMEWVGQQIRYTGIEFDEGAIVPHDPVEVLNHKYGDCKDKATLMVTMLRAAGIPAYVALLNAGSRYDVPADLPGMGLFDHAIVYVPGAHDVWIDATDPWSRLGQLPSGDQGRRALIARPETTALTLTPESTSQENILLESREFRLAENGPASVVEITRPSGVFEGEYRSYYADKPDKDTREGLSGYIKSQYISEKLTKVERSNPSDLSKPFELTIACEKAKRGFTDLTGSGAAIRVESLFTNLPAELQRKDSDDDKKKSDDPDKTKKPRTADWQLDEAFTAEWRYRIVPPLGFVAKPLPKPVRRSIGPALLTEDFSVDQDGAVLAHLAFDSVKRRYTAAEAKELRNTIASIADDPAILIGFEPQAEVLLRDGKVNEALASYRSLVTAHPKEAVHHLQVARVLLDAGMGEAARAEARQAVKLEPDSALAEKTLAQILKQDLVGRSLRAGSDFDGAITAYRAAIKLDPDDNSTQADLAILLEYDSVGRRYSEAAHMKDAVAEYKKLGDDKLRDLGLANNLAFAEFYDGDYAEALKSAQDLNPQPRALMAACVAMLQGGQAGLAEANKLSNDDATYKETARVAGEMLMNLRQYRAAADFLAAGAAGDNAAQTVGLANLLRSARRHEDLTFADTPQDFVKRFFLLSMSPDLTVEKMMPVSSRNAIMVMKREDPEEMKKALETGKRLNMQLARQGSSFDVTIDILLQAFDATVEGSDATGYRVKVQIPGENTSTFYVVKEDGHYKLLDTGEKPNSIAFEMLDRIKAGDLQGAKALLDWLREDQHLEGGDDPLGGPVFPRFWIKGQAADAAKMRLAAASLLVGTKPTANDGIAILEVARKNATTEREKTNITLALSLGYGVLSNFTALNAVASDLVKQVPESRRAFLDAQWALAGLHRYDEAIALADERLKLLDNDTDAIDAKMRIEVDRGNYGAARDWAQKLIDMGKGTAETLNSKAWFALYMPKVEQDDIAMAIKATQMSKNNPHILHTLACLDAVAGKPGDAHDLLLRSMDDLDLDQPNDDYWYAFGLVAERYGERDIAIADYRKLEKPKEEMAIPSSTYQLAQIRLKALGAATN
jgi:transglutaminase-like putative cysteine protease/tetratricopeptide (TPR) repeat protein